MQLLATLLAAATVGIAIAQQTPQCALTCLAELDTESGCQQTDIQCLCSSPAVVRMPDMIVMAGTRLTKLPAGCRSLRPPHLRERS